MYYRVDLSGLPLADFYAVSEAIDGSVVDCQNLPGTQILKVYWKSNVPLEQYFNLPPECSVSPWEESM